MPDWGGILENWAYLFVMVQSTAMVIMGRVLHYCGRAEDFALSIHDGLTSTDPVLATVWGTNVAQSSVDDRCFNPNGTVPNETAHDTVSTRDVGNDTVLVGLRGFYVRLRGYLHSEDRVVFDCWSQQLLNPFTSM